MKLYIHGSACISPQHTLDGFPWVNTMTPNGSRMACVEPDYSVFFDVKTLRRMSRVMKMGATAGMCAMRNAALDMPDGIITSTGYGCLEDTGVFLSKMVSTNEGVLNPTPFMQSTHNTIGSQMAMLLNCMAYNQTYSHGAFSFESALLDASMHASESPEKRLLVGGIDEITDTSHVIQSRFGMFKSGRNESADLFASGSRGTINGEGSSFFVLSGEPSPNAFSCIRELITLYKPDESTLASSAASLCSTLQEPIDLTLLGISGWASQDELLIRLTDRYFPESSVGVFKSLCGEYPSASAFAVWLANAIIRRGAAAPGVIRRDRGRELRNILIFNHYFNTHYSLMLLTPC